jgi:hypothetical protein
MVVLAQLGEQPDRAAWLVRSPARPPAQVSAVDTAGPGAESIPDALAIRIERPATCPERPSTVDELQAIDRRLAVACFGHDPMTFRAWVVDPGEGYGGTCSPFSPAWIRACVLPDYQLRAGVGPNDGTLAVLDAMRSPAATGDLRGVGRWVRVTGHLDDPVSPSCRERSDEPEFASDVESPRALAVLQCRLVFVVDDIVSER